MKKPFFFFWTGWIGLSFFVVLFKGLLSRASSFFLPEFIDPLSPPFAPPSLTHFFGTDELGRDVLIRLLYGTGYSLGFSLVLTLVTLVLGFCVGLGISFAPKNVKGFLTLGVDTFSSLPFFPLALMALTFYPSPLAVVGLLKSLLSSGTVAQAIRMESEILLCSAMLDAAKSQGITRFRMALKYLLPSLIPFGLSFFPLLVFSTILSLATLDYFGLGFPIPLPNLAEMFRQYQENQQAWWLFLFPFLVIAGLLWGFQKIDRRRSKSYPWDHETFGEHLC